LLFTGNLTQKFCKAKSCRSWKKLLHGIQGKGLVGDVFASFATYQDQLHVLQKSIKIHCEKVPMRGYNILRDWE